MTVKPATRHSADRFAEWYGDGSDRSCPTPLQWARILDAPADDPVTLINFFKFRDVAAYGADRPEPDGPLTGQEAFAHYAAVSMPTMERVGGRFLLVGPYKGMFLGEEEDWDLIAIGSYPTAEACLALYADEAYRAAFRHRTAACLRQKVLIGGP